MKAVLWIVVVAAIAAGGYFAAITFGPQFGLFGDRGGAGKPTKPGDRRVILAHSCSLELPERWQQTISRDGAYVFDFPSGAKDRGYLRVDSEEFVGPLREFADGHLKHLTAANPELKIVSDEPFETDAGIPAIKVVASNRIRDVLLAQGMYFVEGLPGRKIMVSYAASVAGDDLKPLFDACVRTIRRMEPELPAEGAWKKD